MSTRYTPRRETDADRQAADDYVSETTSAQRAALRDPPAKIGPVWMSHTDRAKLKTLRAALAKVHPCYAH